MMYTNNVDDNGSKASENFRLKKMHLPLIFLCLQLASCNLNEGIEKPLVYALMSLAFAFSFREGRKSRCLQKWFAAISACHCRKGQEKVAHVLIVHSPAMDYRLLCLQIDRLTDEYERNQGVPWANGSCLCR